MGAGKRGFTMKRKAPNGKAAERGEHPTGDFTIKVCASKTLYRSTKTRK